jgi:hypothetical protein
MKSRPLAEGSEQARKRQRVLFSCTECHRRKQKCNRETPCQHCLTRKAPHLCVEYRAGYDSLDTDSRISRLEVVLDRGVEQILDRLRCLEEGKNSPQRGLSKRSPHRENKDKDVDAATRIVSPSTTEPNDFEPLAITLPYDSARSTYTSLRAHLYPGAESNETIDSRLTAPASQLLQELPEYSRCKKLVQHFFDKVRTTAWMSAVQSKHMHTDGSCLSMPR